MKMWSLNVMILLLFCYGCLSSNERNVYFVSENFFNILHWDPVTPKFPGQRVLYSVRYQKYGAAQHEVEQCQNITALSCNLTLETQLLHDVQYVAEVSVGNVSLGYTKRFKPLAHTTFGPPILSKNTSESRLSVNVTLPRGPNGESIADIVARSNKGSSETVFVYTLSVTQPEWAAQDIENTLGWFVIDLKKQAEYCVDVVYKPSAEWGRRGSEKASFCVSVLDDPSMHWILVGAAALAALLTVSVVLVCTYVKGGKTSLPNVLVKQAASSATHKVQQFPDKNLILSQLEVRTPNEKTAHGAIRVKPTVSSDGSEGYSPQDVPCHAWPDSSGSSVGTDAGRATPNPVDTSGQSSDIYGAVAIHVPNEEDEEFPQAEGEDGEPSRPLLSPDGTNWNDGETGPVLISRGTPSLPGLESGRRDATGPLVLQTLRDVNGQLMLPSFTLPFQSSVDDTESPVGPERKPLLSDLLDSKDRPAFSSLQSLNTSEWSDSGCDDGTPHTLTQAYCNSNYISSQPVSSYLQQGTLSGDASDEQGYKPNWMPAVLHEPETTDGCETRRTECPWAWTGVNAEEDEGTPSPRPIVLGNWTLQIQE